MRLRDHGNETVVGLTLLFALEQQLGSDRAPRYRAAVQRMLDRILQSAAPDGMLYNEVNAETLAPIDTRLSDNWGYVYGAVYTYYQVTGDTKYRDAVRRVLASLPAYRNYAWEPGRNPPLGSFDGYADSIESAIYLVNREPVPEALGWIESEMRVMLGMQRADGHIEDWYGEGNFNRTALLYAYMKSLGVRPVRWEPGVRVGSVARRQPSRRFADDARAAPDPVRLRPPSARAEPPAEPRPPERVPRVVHRGRELALPHRPRRHARRDPARLRADCGDHARRGAVDRRTGGRPPVSPRAALGRRSRHSETNPGPSS